MGTLGTSEPTLLEVGIMGFAALVMVIVCINSYMTGVVRWSRSVYRWEESRGWFRFGIFVTLMGAVCVIGLLLLLLMQYLGWWHVRWGGEV